MKRTTIIGTILIAAMTGAESSCVNIGTEEEKPVITVTIEPLRYFTEEIAGEKFDVVTIVPKGSDPETYEPTARQMAALQRSELLIEIGDLGFERTWLNRMHGEAQHLIIINTSENIVRVSREGSADPHTWMSTTNALTIADNIYKALKRIDMKDSLYFKDRLLTLRRTIMDTEIAINEKLDSIKSRTFIIYHPALTYFANDYGLRQLAIEEGGHEPTAASMGQLIEEARKDKARVMLVQQEYGSRSTATIEKETGTKRATINPLNYNWNEEMRSIADKLANNAE